MKQIDIPGNAESIDHRRSLSGRKSETTSRLGCDADDLISLPSSMSLLGFTFLRSPVAISTLGESTVRLAHEVI